MSSKASILSKIRAAGGPIRDDQDRQDAVSERLRKHPSGIIPKQSDAPAKQLKQFKAKLTAAAASHESCKPGELANVVANYLRSRNLPARIRMGDDKRLSGFKKTASDLLEVSVGPSDGNDLVCLSHAFGGVSETGTLFMTSGKANPTTLNLLPEHHLVVVRESDVTGSYEDLLAKVRKRFGRGTMPRTLNMITGPSRSGDIGGQLILGAHGPLALHVIIVKD